MEEGPITNMQVLHPSRRRLRAGDVFAAKFPRVDYVFGRVIAVDLPPERAPLPGANLVYVYDERRHEMQIEVGSLTTARLLVPPMFINRLPWSRGYFETVASHPLRDTDVLPAHYFWSVARSRFVDQEGAPLDYEPPPPVGDWGLHSFRTFDDVISDALGIARVPEDAERR